MCARDSVDGLPAPRAVEVSPQVAVPVGHHTPACRGPRSSDTHPPTPTKPLGRPWRRESVRRGCRHITQPTFSFRLTEQLRWGVSRASRWRVRSPGSSQCVTPSPSIVLWTRGSISLRRVETKVLMGCSQDVLCPWTGSHSGLETGWES